ncbi:AAA family ATPase, partial [Neisseria sp. P0009.S007]
EAQHLHMKVDDAALDLIAKAGFDNVYGALTLKRAIQSEIENTLSKALLEGKYAPDITIHVKEEGGKILFA